MDCPASPWPSCFAGAGEARARCRALDWSGSPLGPAAQWGPALRAAAQICLDAPSAMAVWAGPALALIHNDAYARVLGAKVDWAMGRSVGDVWSEVRDEVEPQFRQVLERGEPLRLEDVRFELDRSGRREEAWFDYGLSPVREADGRIVAVLNIVEETTDLVRARSDRENRYRALFDSIDEGFCIVQAMLDDAGVGVDYRFVEINPAFERHTGLRGAIGRTARELVPDLEPHWPAIYGRIATSGRAERFTDESAAMGRWFEVDAFRLGRPEELKVALLFRDITARRRAEEALRESQARLEHADRQKDRFLAQLSHELRNPLAPIRASLDLLERLPPDGGPARQALAVIDRQVGQLTTLVNDLLDLNRITLGKVQLQRTLLDLNEVARRSMEDHRDPFERAGVATRMTLAPRPVTVDADPTRLAQVLGNLLRNAAQFTPRGGQVGLEVEADAAQGEALLHVLDNGVGMSPRMLEQLFEPFMQADETLARSQGGLGLGLALVKHLVELHGGSVEARSAGAGAGSQLTVRLPLTGAALPADDDARGATAGTTRRRVLLIDDNVDAAECLRMLLELDGHEVATAHDGPDGLALARRFGPEIVICDIGLPGMDGYAVAGAMRAEPALRGTRLIALSGYAAPSDRQRAAAAGFEQHLAKPADLETLAALLAKPPAS